jgi:thiaminase/transcriptional activator TenA
MRALLIAAARAPSEPDIAMFAQHAVGAIEVERSLHESLFPELGLTAETVAAMPIAPTNLAYTSYQLAVAYGGSFPEALGALLPCYWIYWEVGKELLAKGSPDATFSSRCRTSDDRADDVADRHRLELHRPRA